LILEFFDVSKSLDDNFLNFYFGVYEFMCQFIFGDLKYARFFYEGDVILLQFVFITCFFKI
jgi:hypothetical protein